MTGNVAASRKSAERISSSRFGCPEATLDTSIETAHRGGERVSVWHLHLAADGGEPAGHPGNGHVADGELDERVRRVDGPGARLKGCGCHE